jgi:hypothetical protein
LQTLFTSSTVIYSGTFIFSSFHEASNVAVEQGRISERKTKDEKVVEKDKKSATAIYKPSAQTAWFWCVAVITLV